MCTKENLNHIQIWKARGEGRERNAVKRTRDREKNGEEQGKEKGQKKISAQEPSKPKLRARRPRQLRTGTGTLISLHEIKLTSFFCGGSKREEKRKRGEEADRGERGKGETALETASTMPLLMLLLTPQPSPVRAPGAR